MSHIRIQPTLFYREVRTKPTMNSYSVLLCMSVFLSVKAQDLTSTRTKHPKHFQSYYPNTKFKPGSSYEAIPPLYNPSDICFNPNYYGLLNNQMSPIPQPNIYYIPNIQPAQSPYPPSAWSSYTPWTWNNYPYMGNPSTGLPLTSSSSSPIKSTDHLGMNLPQTATSSSSSAPEAFQHENETSTIPKPITISRPTISVKIVPPTFNENATTITNIAPPLSSDTDQSSQNSRLDEKTRKMIKKLLEMGSRFAGKSKEDKRTRDTQDDDEGPAQQPLPSNEMVILPHGEKILSNEYPLPKTTYGNKNEPKSSFDRLKIFTEFNPPA
ncbi:uncharacterized protein LOC135841955 [Planococcus citri]|uniref:uncharacterized protein LOC135841955 n=1 Tax=Planococcus citri TaxID=170843 RepID=UPI0031F95DBC